MRTQSEILLLFVYDPETGLASRLVGAVADSLPPQLLNTLSASPWREFIAVAFGVDQPVSVPRLRANEFINGVNLGLREIPIEGVVTPQSLRRSLAEAVVVLAEEMRFADPTRNAA